MTPTILSERFAAFVEILDQFESIDALLRGDDPTGKKRADYLLGNRRYIIEQKALISNPVGRPQKFVDKLAEKRGFEYFGMRSTHEIFSQQPDAEDLQRRMVLDLARGIDDIVAKADKQTTDTRAIFNIPDAAGILVILNESAGLLQPSVINYALSNVFRKRKPDGTFRYPANEVVIVVSEAPRLANVNRRQEPAFPIIYFPSPQRKPRADVEVFSDALARQWAEFNSASLVTIPVDVNLKPKQHGT